MENVCFVLQWVLNFFSLSHWSLSSFFSASLSGCVSGLWVQTKPHTLSVPCNRLWRLSCASRSSSSTLGGLPEERNTFTGCRHDDLEWAVAVAFSRPELAAAREGESQ